MRRIASTLVGFALALTTALGGAPLGNASLAHAGSSSCATTPPAPPQSGGSVTWTQVEGPCYHVLGLYVVPANATLTIEAGVEVQFDYASTVPGAVEISSGGVLNAIGTSSNHIVLHSPTGYVGSWGGILFDAGAAGSSITYADISGAGAGSMAAVTSAGATNALTVDHTTFANNASTNNASGDILLTDPGIGTHITFSTFTSNTSGISIMQTAPSLSSISITDNDISASSTGGIAILGSPTLTFTGDISRNNVHNLYAATLCGIAIYPTAQAGLYSGNQIHDTVVNDQCGISFLGPSVGLTVSNNSVYNVQCNANCIEHGIVLAGAATSPSITGNQVHDISGTNAPAGIIFNSSASQPSISNNTLATLAGPNSGIFFGGAVTGATVQANALSNLSGSTSGIQMDAGSLDGSVTVKGNSLSGFSGTGSGIQIGGTIASTAQVFVSVNNLSGFTSTSGASGISLLDNFPGAQMSIDHNALTNLAGIDSGINVASSKTVSNLSISSNIVQGVPQGGILFGGGKPNCSTCGTITLSNVTVANNLVTTSDAGVNLASTVSTANQPSIVNNTFANNSGTYGAGTVCVGASCPPNSPIPVGSGIQFNASSPVVTNNIIAGNAVAGIGGTGAATVSFNDVFNNGASGTNNYVGLASQTGTNGNISADPLFVGANNFTPGPGSAAIGTGKNSGDMGAFPAAVVAPTATLVPVTSAPAPSTAPASLPASVPADVVNSLSNAGISFSVPAVPAAGVAAAPQDVPVPLAPLATGALVLPNSTLLTTAVLNSILTAPGPVAVNAAINSSLGGVIVAGNVAISFSPQSLAGLLGGTTTGGQAGAGPVVNIEVRPQPAVTTPGGPTQFSPNGTILDIVITNAATGEVITTFPSPVPVTMKYNASDVGQANGNANNLAAAYVIDANSPEIENPLHFPPGTFVLFGPSYTTLDIAAGTLTVFTQAIGSVLSVVTNPVGYVQTVSSDAPVSSSFDPNTSQTFGTKPAQSYLQVVEPQVGTRLLVLDPATGNYGYVDAKDVGPSGPPPANSATAVVRGLLAN